MNISKIEERFLNELSFFTVCSSSPELGKFFKTQVNISNPNSIICNFSDFKKEQESNLFFSKISFNNGKLGDLYIVLTEKDALDFSRFAISKRLNKNKESIVWDDFSKSAIEEIMNIMGGNMTEVLSLIFKEEVNIEAPELITFKGAFGNLLANDEKIVVSSFEIDVLEEMNITLFEITPKYFFDKILKNVMKNE